ncbi:MAG TPA: hypothetical protein VGZ29_02140 [Terriglobia bacterium]|nr:hypothetical protein [Terriglobia bacterium]
MKRLPFLAALLAAVFVAWAMPHCAMSRGAGNALAPASLVQTAGDAAPQTNEQGGNPNTGASQTQPGTPNNPNPGHPPSAPGNPDNQTPPRPQVQPGNPSTSQPGTPGTTQNNPGNTQAQPGTSPSTPQGSSQTPGNPRPPVR